jgi:hypothetical protein
MLKNVTRVATFTDRMRVLVKTSYCVVGEIFMGTIWRTKPYRNPREENGLNFSIINALAKAGYNPEGTFLDLETTKYGSKKKERHITYKSMFRLESIVYKGKDI